MGIKNINKLLKEYAPNSIKEYNISNYNGKLIAIDTSLVLYQYISALRNSGKDLTNNNDDITTHMYAIIQKTISLLDKGLKPVYIFDGKAPDIKKNTLEKRKKLKQNAEKKKIAALTKEEEIKFFKRSLFITRKQYDECKNILDILGIPYIQASGEADCLCAYLVKKKLVYAAYSEDMDFLTFGCSKLIKNLKGNKKIIELNLEDILEELDISYESFINLTILLGCDYAPTIKGIGYKTALKLIKEHNDIKTFINKNTKFKIPKNYEYDEIIDYYNNPPINIDTINIKFKKPKINEFKIILENNNFSDNLIKRYINKINNFHYHI